MNKKSLKKSIDNFLNTPDDKPFLFKERQIARVKKGVSNDGQTPEYWDGAIVEIIKRKKTSLYKSHIYEVLHVEKNIKCEFRENEIDLRYKKLW